MIKRVFISGPYSSNPEENTKKAIKVFHELFQYGFTPYCPHVYQMIEKDSKISYENWIGYFFEWLRLCDAVIRIPGESSGADREVEFADSIGIPVYESVSELMFDIDEWRRT